MVMVKNKSVSSLPWLTDELMQEVRKHFEPKYKRKLSEDEVYEIAENLTEVIEAYLKMKWRQKSGNDIRNDTKLKNL